MIEQTLEERTSNIKKMDSIELLYTLSPEAKAEIERRGMHKSKSLKAFKFISRMGGAVLVSLVGLTVGEHLLHGEDSVSLGSYVAASYFVLHGMTDLVTGRHHYLPMRALFNIRNKIYNKGEQNDR